MIYDGNGLDNLKEVVDKAVLILRPKKTQFDSIVVRGNSGCLVGAPVSLRLKVPLVVIRKSDERSRDGKTVVNGSRIGKRWVFLDDFISGGTTKRACRDEIEKFETNHILGTFGTHSRCVAHYMYSYSVSNKWEKLPVDYDD